MVHTPPVTARSDPAPERTPSATPTGLRGTFGLAGSVGLVAALFATYWDDSWHTDRGRDDFAIGPHLLLYGGVLVALGSIAAWAADARRRNGSWRLSRTAERPLGLAAAGAAATLVSAPVDNAWHIAFGRDAVLWSPPHLLGVAGMLTLTVGMLSGVRRSTGRAARTARLLTAAGVIAALQIPVLEYDSDVPQFAAVWYLPVAVAGLLLAAVVLEDLTVSRWSLTAAAAAYVVLRLGVVGFLAAGGFSTTLVAPALVPVALYEVLRGRAQSVRAAALVGSAPLAWWTAVALQEGAGTEVPLATVAVVTAAGLVLVAGAGPVTRTAMSGRGAQTLVAVAAAAAAAAVWAAPAWAHDPGQGPVVEQVTISVDRRSGPAEVTVEVDSPCGTLAPGRTVARRAGVSVTGTLGTGIPVPSGCKYQGVIPGPGHGQWFVYAEFGRSAERAEVWLAAPDGEAVTGQRWLYTPPDPAGSGLRTVAGAAMLAAVVALVYLTVSETRRIAELDPGHPAAMRVTAHGAQP